MKKLKYYLSIILLSVFILLPSCVNNSDGKDDPEKPGGGGVELTPDNIQKGDWEIAYMTQRVQVTDKSTPVTFRMYGMDGFSKEFYKDSLYMERNTYGEETISEGIYALNSKLDSIVLKYKFQDHDSELMKDSTSRIQVYKLTDKILIYHVSYYKKLDDDPAFRQLVFYLRDRKTAPDEFLKSNNDLLVNEKKGRIDPKALHGSWVIEGIRVSSKNANQSNWTPTDSDIEKQERDSLANVGLVYTYNTLSAPFKFKEIHPEGQVKEGTFTITDDVMHYYYENEDEGKTKKVMSSMAVDMDAHGQSFRYTSNTYSPAASSFSVQRVTVLFKKKL